MIIEGTVFATANCPGMIAIEEPDRAGFFMAITPNGERELVDTREVVPNTEFQVMPTNVDRMVGFIRLVTGL